MIENGDEIKDTSGKRIENVTIKNCEQDLKEISRERRGTSGFLIQYL